MAEASSKRPAPTKRTQATQLARRTVGGPPSDLSLTILQPDQRVEGWYESRRPHSTMHERVSATLWGFRTFVIDDRAVTECMVLPRERNSTFGFLALSAFTPKEMTHDGFGNRQPRGRMLARQTTDLDGPTLEDPF